MKIIVRVYGYILLAYTGWRTFDFINSQLPKNDISFWLSIAFLFATEAGLLIWHELNLSHVTTKNQQDVSSWMTWIDFVASLAAGIADMILHQTLIEGYTVPPILAQFLIFGLPITMAGNVAAIIYYQSNDAKKQIEKAKRQLRFEIYEKSLAELRENSEQIAEAMKKDIYRELKSDVLGKIGKDFAAVGIPDVETKPKNNQSVTKKIANKFADVFGKNDPTSNNGVEVEENFTSPQNGE